MLIWESPRGRLNVSSNPGQIEGLISRIEDEKASRAVLLIASAAALAMLAASFLRRVPVAWILIVAALASLYRFISKCPSCDSGPDLFGVDPGAFGAICYALIACLTSFSQGSRIRGLVSLFCGGVCVWQVFEFRTSMEACAPCGVVLAANAAAVILALTETEGSLAGAVKVTVRQSVTPRLVPPAVLVVCGVSMLPLANAQIKGGLTAAQFTNLPEPQYMGRNISQLGIPPSGQGVQVILLGLRTCHPCEEALAFLSAQDEIKFRYIQLVQRGESAVGESLRYDAAKFPHAPTIFVVDPSGNIATQFYGWSDDPRWTASFHSTVTQAIKDLKQANEIKSGKQS